MLLNDGTRDAPKLRVYLNMDNLADLPGWSVWGGLQGPARFQRLAADGFEGVQLTDDAPPPEGCLPYCGLDRINRPEEADPIAAKHRARGDQCLTVHAGWGTEDDDEMDRLVEAILRASEKHRLPIFIETHRATITQDMWRTVRLTERFPEIRFNGDFSHYYCGQEMKYGGTAAKIAFLQPVFERVGFMHGRVASPGCIQAPVARPFHQRPPHATGETDYQAEFRQIWTAAMRGFLTRARPGDVLIFAPELLSGLHYYARQFPGPDGRFREETDRYEQALLLQDLARVCWNDAQRFLLGN